MQENYIEFQLGNWVIYHPEGNYCTIKSLSPIITLEGALKNYHCTIDQIGKIKITEYKLQVCGFTVRFPKYIKQINDNFFIALAFSSFGIYKLYLNDDELCKIQYIHQVQNAYHTITGEFLPGNLFGVKEK